MIVFFLIKKMFNTKFVLQIEPIDKIDKFDKIEKV